jgi:hypothetical protein
LAPVCFCIPQSFPYLLGDALWALTVFLLFAVILNRAATGKVAILAFGFAAGIEISQIYHAPWIDSIRATTLGTLVLGSVFNWPDFIAYLGGIGAGALAEMAVPLRFRGRE